MNDVLGKLNQLQVKGDLFKDVKYYVTGNLEPEVCYEFNVFETVLMLKYAKLPV